jgi:hypothetical protein
MLNDECRVDRTGMPHRTLSSRIRLKIRTRTMICASFTIHHSTFNISQ